MVTRRYTSNNPVEENKLERLASYRQIQAMSQQLNFLSNARIPNIDFFTTPANVHIHPVRKGSTRVKHLENGRIRAGHQNTQTGEVTKLLPNDGAWWNHIPLLVLQLDQGPTCCGGAA